MSNLSTSRKRRRAAVTGLAVLGLVAATAVAPQAATAGPRHRADSHAMQATLQQDVDALNAAGASGVLAEIVDSGTPTYARAGEAVRGTHLPVPFDAHFRIASISKLYIAVIVMELVGEGRLSLDDSVERWLPGVVDGNGYVGSDITIRELVAHTSGIFDYTQSPSFEARLLSSDSFNQTRFQHSDPRDLVAQALAHPPLFAPGTNYLYSNTDYVLLGLVIKAVTGQTWSAQLYQRIIAPLHLVDTSVPGDNPFVPLPALDGYNIYSSDPANRVYTDVTVENITWADAAGSIISTTADVNRFYHALFAGQLLSPALLAEMKQSVPGAPPSAGLGFGHQVLDCGAEINGAVGLVPGYNTYVFSNDDGSRTIVLEIATSTFSEQQFFDDANLDAFNVIEHAFCPTQ
jgi:D-alanyl-D-alanine carboxypeptidase